MLIDSRSTKWFRVTEGLWYKVLLYWLSCNKIPDTHNLKDEGFIVGHVFRGVILWLAGTSNSWHSGKEAKEKGARDRLCFPRSCTHELPSHNQTYSSPVFSAKLQANHVNKIEHQIPPFVKLAYIGIQISMYLTCSLRKHNDCVIFFSCKM